jgi:hypothetical protein
MRQRDVSITLSSHQEVRTIMAVNQNRALPADTIESDRASLVGLKKLSDYAPANRGIAIEVLGALEAQLRQAQEAEILARAALNAARDAHIAAGWELHNAMLSAKAAVIGQYGANSDAVHSVGLKKKSDYRRPSRRRNGTSS